MQKQAALRFIQRAEGWQVFAPGIADILLYQWLLMEVIAGLKKTVLSVFHELNLACTFCDYLFVLKDGRIAAQGTPREICTPQMLEEVFRVRADVLALEDGRPYIVYRGSIR